ncbi:MAG TPA: glycosyltransferase family 9 protein, partial [Burkholderiales bacterium]
SHVNARLEQFRSHPPREVCILRLSAIGDTCHALPVVRTLQRAWPQTRFTWAIGGTEAMLMSGIDGVELVALNKPSGLSGFMDLRRRLAGRRFDLLLMMHASLRANLTSLLIHARVRLGFDRARARDYQYWFSNARIAARPREHVMDGLFGFAEALGIGERLLRWDIPVSEEDSAFAARHIPPGCRALVISPCSSQRFRNYRNWRIENYAALAEHAARVHGARVIVTGGPTDLEVQYADGICRLARKSAPVNLVGRTTLKQLLALLDRADVLVCPDSGPAHMATAVGTPVIGLYATSNRFRTGPYLSQRWVVDHYPEAVRMEFGTEVDKIPWGARVRDPDAMDLIKVEEVTARLDQFFASPAPATERR